MAALQGVAVGDASAETEGEAAAENIERRRIKLRGIKCRDFLFVRVGRVFVPCMTRDKKWSLHRSPSFLSFSNIKRVAKKEKIGSHR